MSHGGGPGLLLNCIGPSEADTPQNKAYPACFLNLRPGECQGKDRHTPRAVLSSP